MDKPPLYSSYAVYLNENVNNLNTVQREIYSHLGLPTTFSEKILEYIIEIITDGLKMTT